MPPVTFYVTDDEYSALQARAADARTQLRSYLRHELLGPHAQADVPAELEDHEARISRLEELVITLGLGA